MPILGSHDSLVMHSRSARGRRLSAPAQWRVFSPSDQRQSQPPKNFSEGTPIKLGDACPNDQKFRWLVAELEIPATIGNESTAGKVVGLQFNCGDGGEVYVNGVSRPASTTIIPRWSS